MLCPLWAGSSKYAVERAAFFNLPRWVVITIDCFEDAINAQAAANEEGGSVDKEEVKKWRQILAGVKDD